RPRRLSQPGRLPGDQRGVEGGRRSDAHLRHHEARGGRRGGDGARGEGSLHRPAQGGRAGGRGPGLHLPPLGQRQGEPRLEAARPHQRGAHEPGRPDRAGGGGEGTPGLVRAAPAADQGARALRQRAAPARGRALGEPEHRRGGRRGLGGRGALSAGSGASEADRRGVPHRRGRGRRDGARRGPARARRRGRARGGRGGGAGRARAEGEAPRQGQGGEEGPRREEAGPGQEEGRGEEAGREAGEEGCAEEAGGEGPGEEARREAGEEEVTRGATTVIRLVTLDAYDPKVIDRLCKVLYTAFGVGCEHAGDMPLPGGQSEPFDAQALLQALPSPRAYADDKILYLTSRKLKPRSLVSGDVPSSGLSNQNGPRA